MFLRAIYILVCDSYLTLFESHLYPSKLWIHLPFPLIIKICVEFMVFKNTLTFIISLDSPHIPMR